MERPENHLITSLPAKDRRSLLGICEPVDLRLSEVLCEPGDLTRHVYFPRESFVSLVTLADVKLGVEVGMVGREGMIGVQLALDVPVQPLRALVQGAGPAWRAEAAAFRGELARSTPLQSLLHRYIYVLMAQLASSAACLHFHAIEPRLARWFLMSQDRAGGDHFHVTHEFLSYMLGVRRVGITAAAGALQLAGLIHYHRGNVTVLDRSGLEHEACACYALGRQVYADVLP